MNLNSMIFILLASATLALAGCDKPAEADDNYASLSTVIDGKTWKQFNEGASLDNRYGTLYTFKDAQSACPEGWRLPTRDEAASLGANSSDWTNENGTPGRWLSGSQEYSVSVPAVFLPAESASTNIGLYWATGDSESGTGTMYYLSVNEYRIEIAQTRNNLNTYFVRCISK